MGHEEIRVLSGWDFCFARHKQIDQAARVSSCRRDHNPITDLVQVDALERKRLSKSLASGIAIVPTPRQLSKYEREGKTRVSTDDYVRICAQK